MKLCVLGLGYVGTVAAGCLAREGHQVVGVDADPDFRDVPGRLADGQTVIDFVRITDPRSVTAGVYDGICW